jgi:hypothetical protein
MTQSVAIGQHDARRASAPASLGINRSGNQDHAAIFESEGKTDSCKECLS